MGQIVYSAFEGISVPADATCDVYSVLAGASNKIKMLGWGISSADIAAEAIALKFHRITAFGTGGTAPALEEKADEDSGAITASCRQLDTTPGADGGGIQAYQWEQLGELREIYTPEMAPKADLADGFALTWLSAVTATCSGWFCWEEL